MRNSGSPQIPGAARTVTAVFAGLALASPAPAYAAGPAGAANGDFMAAAQAAGSVSAADRDFMAAVHTVASFAARAGALAKTNAGAGSIRTMATRIVEQDRQLDGLARGTAARLRCPLPSPSPLPLDRLATAKGPGFDADYVDRLRATDGSLLRMAAAIRVDTRNDLVRDLAQRTTMTMATQLPLVEGSGLVDFQALSTVTLQPTPPAAGRIGPTVDPEMLAAARRRDGFLWPSVTVDLAVLGAATLVAAIAAGRLMRSRRPRRAR